MDSLLVIAGPGILASLWIIAGVCLTYEIWDLFE